MADIKKQSKQCKTCGLSFNNRKKWASRGLWDSIQYCSERCRSAKKRLNTSLNKQSIN